MMAIKTQFDGRKIEVPPELLGKQAAEVVILYDERGNNGAHGGESSIWDVCGKATTTRSRGDINRQIDEDRDSWDPK